MPTHKHIRSSTANKRPTTAIADGQIALNTNAASPGLFFKDSAGTTLIKVGPVHVGTTAPNVTPASGGSSGNSTGEIWLDTSLTPNGVKIWSGSAWVNATPIGSTTIQGLLELATNAETQAGSDTARAVTPAALQSKMSDSATTSSATTIASSTAVKTAYDLANAALPKSGGTVTGALEIGTTGSLVFEGSTADGFETTLAVVDPTADRTITLPNVTGSVVTTGDSGTVTSTMIADGAIVNADVNASAAIAGTKISPDFGGQNVVTTGRVGVGSAGSTNVNLNIAKALTGATTSYGVLVDSTAQSDVTTSAIGYTSSLDTAAASFTLNNLIHYNTVQAAFGAGSTVNTQYGFNAASSLTGATTNYGFYSQLASASGRWNFFANSTAPNYYAGDVRTNTVFLSRTAPVNSNVTATATASSLLDGIRTGTPTADINLQVPTGANMDAAFQDLQNNQAFEWSVINLATAASGFDITVTSNTTHTLVGNMNVTGETSGRFKTRKTATDTFVTYRIA